MTSVTFSRRHLLASVGGLALTAGLPVRAGDPWPAKPLRIIVPFGPGGPADLSARALGELIAPQLGQPIVVDNKPGAGTIIAAQAVASAPATVKADRSRCALQFDPVGKKTFKQSCDIIASALS